MKSFGEHIRRTSIGPFPGRGGTGTTELLEPLGGVAEADGKSWNINGKNVEKHGQTARYDIYILYIYIYVKYIYILYIYIL